MFGTNGVRGIVNSRAMDSQFALRLGQAIGTFMRGTVAIGTDARTSNEMLKSACASGLMSAGCEVLDCGIVPTPALQYAVREKKVAGGVVITASHNPPEFNGIKCIDRDGTEMSRNNEEVIESLYHSCQFANAEWDALGRMRPYENATRSYIEGIVRQVDVRAIRKAELRIAVDCGNGTGSLVAPRLLKALGVRYVALNANLDGSFPGHYSEPTPENTKDLIELVKSGEFDFGFINDGDADRTVFVDDTGRYLHGDRSLALVAHYICREKKGGLVVTSIGSSMCVEDAARMAGGSVVYTKVGSPIIARVMMERGGVFGGEENGGLIFPEFQYCRDGAMAAAKMLEIVAKHGKLSVLNDNIPAYSQYKTRTKCPEDKKGPVMDKLAKTASGERVDRTDGVKIFLKEGWVLVRPSGTEPIFRVFSEARTPDRARKLAEEYIAKVDRLVRG